MMRRITNVLTSVTTIFTINRTAFNAEIAISFNDVATMGSTALGEVNDGNVSNFLVDILVSL